MANVSSIDEKGTEVIVVSAEDKAAINELFYKTLDQVHKKFPHVAVKYTLNFLPRVSIPVLKSSSESHNGNTRPLTTVEDPRPR